VCLLTGCMNHTSDEPIDTYALKDIDGNVYTAVRIGTQTWMVENLKVTKYRNGDPITNITDYSSWKNTLTTGAYCWYGNDLANKADYGALYNWYALSDPRGLVPLGWHIPTDAEWATLISFLGGLNEAGGKLKEAGLEHWSGPNIANNVSGFTALPGGYQEGLGNSTSGINVCGVWWSSTLENGTNLNVWTYRLDNNLFNVQRSLSGKYEGFSVRCIMD
jgi:uncharacterized protein (TIGR02145 family)